MPENLPNETIQTIIDWHTATFPEGTFQGQLDKFDEEFGEWEDSNYQDVSELADMFIVACGISRFDAYAGMDAFHTVQEELLMYAINPAALLDAINAKMAVNRNRSWEKQDGQYKHI